MVVFGAAGSVPKTSRAFVFVVLGFFCSVCRDERNESILVFAIAPRLGSSVQCSFAAPGLAAIGLEPVQRLKSDAFSPLHRAYLMNGLAAALKGRSMAVS